MSLTSRRSVAPSRRLRLRNRLRGSRSEPWLSSLVVAVAGVAVAVVVRRLLGLLWKRVRGVDAPKTPTAEGVPWGEAIAWALVSGTSAGLARLIGRRIALAGWRKLLKAEPPSRPKLRS